MIRPAFALLLAMVPLGAAANQLFVSPKGSDRGQCNSPKKPCATIGRACSVANSHAGRVTNIQVAPGVFQTNTSCDVYYHRLVFVSGEQSIVCGQPPGILIDDGDDVFGITVDR